MTNTRKMLIIAIVAIVFIVALLLFTTYNTTAATDTNDAIDNTDNADTDTSEGDDVWWDFFGYNDEWFDGWESDTDPTDNGGNWYEWGSNEADTKSYLNNSSYPRGMKNNNPGNIRVGSSDWVGKIPLNQNTDGAFEQFERYKYGVRAMLVLFRNYMQIYGKNTIRKIISKWAPTTENNTNSYISSVVQKTGIPADQVLSWSPAVFPIVQAMAVHENGRADAITDEDIQLAYSLI